MVSARYPTMLRPRHAMPPDRPGVVERAYQMARSGQFHYVEEIRRELDREGYYPCRAHIAGAALLKSLRSEISTALDKISLRPPA